MGKTVTIAFRLKNAYRVNSILYAIGQIPLLRRLLPEKLYQVRGLKVFANILAILWEIVAMFGFKFLYFATVVCGIGALYDIAPPADTFLHILLFLSLIGALINTQIFQVGRDKYYAIILMRMDARSYTISQFGYELGKVICGFLPCTLVFGLARGVPLWICLVLPVCVAAIKLCYAGVSLWAYARFGWVSNETRLTKYIWIAAALLLALGHGLPAVGIALPVGVSTAVMLAWIPLGLLAGRKLLRFDNYRPLYQQLLSKLWNQMDDAKQAVKRTTEKAISADTTISSNRSGFEFLNELFVKRHKKILWEATQKISIVCVAVFVIGGVVVMFRPDIAEIVNKMLLQWLPYFVFILYSLNRGTNFTRALFLNCDHSLLTYACYKQPKFVLRLFQLRLREIMKINAVPALIIGCGLAVLLYLSGGTKNPLNYAVLVASTLCISLFFSVHYLTIYYLLQPYNVGTELKSGTYRLVLLATYFVCFVLMQVRMPIITFGLACIAFCVLYCVVACVLVYRLAPRTFRLRN